MEIRAARIEDAAGIAAVYAPHVLHGAATFEEEPPTPAEMAARLRRVLDRRWPWLVAEEGGLVLGYAYCTQFHERAAYRYACEDSIYIAREALRRGIGNALLGRLIEEARSCGFRQMFAVIGDSTNSASIGLHVHHGFARAGLLHAAGHKFGRDIDVVYMQKTIG